MTSTRVALFAAGLLATAGTALLAFILWYVIIYEQHATVLATGMAGAAIAGPLFGTIAALHAERWRPLLVGSAVGAGILLAMDYVAV